MMSFTALLSVVQPWIIGQAIDEGVANDDFAAMRLFTILFYWRQSLSLLPTASALN